MASVHGDTIAPAPSPTRAADRGGYFIGYAAICLAIAVAGFAPSFWMPVASGGFNGSPLLVLHGLVFTAWPLLFLVQTVLVERGQISRHRAWGVAGVSLATMMVAVGIATVGFQLFDRLAAGYGARALAFTILPLSNLVLFAGFVAAALLNLARPDWHKRLMMLASAVVLLAAFARIIFYVVDGRPLGPVPALTPPGEPMMALRPGALVLLLMLGAAWVERRRRGDWHPAWAWGIGVFIVVAVARVPLAHSAAWQSAATALARFA